MGTEIATDQINQTLIWFTESLGDIVKYTGFSLLIMAVILWIFVTLWVWTDSGERTQNRAFRIFVTVFVLPFNVPGLLIYFMIRPTLTIDEMYWAELERRYLMYQTIDLDDCPKCGEGLMPGFNNCPACGFEIKSECTGCGVNIHRDYKFCPFCGTQNRQRAVRKEEMTPMKMEQEIKEQREDVVESIENQNMRYTKTSGLVDKVGKWAIAKYGELSEAFKRVKVKSESAIKSTIEKRKRKNKTQLNQSDKTMISKNGNKKNSKKKSSNAKNSTKKSKKKKSSNSKNTTKKSKKKKKSRSKKKKKKKRK